MKKSFQLSAIAIAVSLSASAFAADISADPTIEASDDINIHVDGGNNGNGGYGSLNVYKGQAGQPNTQLLVHIDNDTYGGTTINTNTTITGNLAVNGGTSTILTAAPVSTGADLVIPTVNPAFSNTTQPFSQNRVDTQDQTRSVDNQVINQNKFQLNTSEQTGQQSWTTAQTASAQYDANGVIVPGSLTGPVLGATVDNGFVASSVNKVQDLTLGRNNTSEDYRLSITKTDNGVANTTNVAATGITTSRINGNGAGGALVLHGGTTSTTQTLDDSGVSFVTTDIGGNVTGTTTIDANGNLVVKGRDVLANLDQGDAATLAAANTYTDGQVAAEATTRAAADVALNVRVDQEAAARIAGDAATLAAANTYTDGQVANEAAARIAGDAATLAAANTYTDGQVANEAAARIAGDQSIRNDIATQVTTNALVVNGQSTFNGPVTAGTINANVGNITTINATTVKAATVDLGNSSNTVTTNTAPSANRLTARYNTTVNGTATTIYETQSGGVSTYYTINGTVATEFTNAAVISTLGTTVAPVAGGTTTTQAVVNTTTETLKQVNATAVTYGEVKTQQDAVTVNGTLNNAQAINVNVGTGAPVEVNNQSVSTGIIGTTNGNNVYGTVATAKTTGTNGTVTSNQTTTLTANGLSVKDTVSGASTTVTAGSVSTGTVTANTVVVGGKSVTAEFARVDAAAAAETTRVNTAISAGDAATLTSANAYTNVRANQLNTRIDDVQKTAYRGVAIALAAQQQVPNIKPGQFAVFGGVGHYESESAAAVGVVGALNDRLSMSAALGFASGSEIGGRVGVAYVFGGN